MVAPLALSDHVVGTVTLITLAVELEYTWGWRKKQMIARIVARNIDGLKLEIMPQAEIQIFSESSQGKCLL
jgi:hypothetical protein